MVRERNVVPLTEAIARFSYNRAKWLEDIGPDMKHRGRLRPGAIADITIFDGETVRDNSDYVVGR